MFAVWPITCLPDLRNGGAKGGVAVSLPFIIAIMLAVPCSRATSM